MHDAVHRRMRVIADRIGALARLRGQFLGARDELPRDRIVGIVGIDQRGDVRRDRDRIARRDPLQIGQLLRRARGHGATSSAGSPQCRSGAACRS